MVVELHPAYAKALATRCASRRGAREFAGVLLLPGSAYYVDEHRMLRVPVDYNGAPIAGHARWPDVQAYEDAAKQGQVLDEVDFVESQFTPVASIRVSTNALRDAISRRKVVGIVAHGDDAVVFGVDNTGRCAAVRRVPARATCRPSPVCLLRRFLEDALDNPGVTATIDVQEREDGSWLPTSRYVRLCVGDAVEYITTWRVEPQVCAEAWRRAKGAA